MAYDNAHFAALTCPSSVTWTNDISQLFTPTDVDHMKQVTSGALDLSSYTSTKVWASKIYAYVKEGIMPPVGSGDPNIPWTAEMINLFGCWVAASCPE